MKVLVIGSGGREHALAWKIAQSPKVEKVFVLPGNGGISSRQGGTECVTGVGLADFEAIADFVEAQKVDLTVVGPEVPLVNGIVDYFTERGLKIFGPSKKGSLIEGSKVFAKQLMQKYNIPTAKFEIFDNPEDALSFIHRLPITDYLPAGDLPKGDRLPVVIKADGLAAGKGAIVCSSKEQARNAIDMIMVQKKFGEAGRQIVIEECLRGQEVSVICFTDGKTMLPLLVSQDHKPVFDGDEGPNTGGMGAYAPVPFVDDSLQEEISQKILLRIVESLRKQGIIYKGVLYAGLMLTEEGPKVLEFNVRFGDPETQPVLPLLKNDLAEVMEAVLEERLSEINLRWEDEFGVCVVVASGGYPGKYEKGKEIFGLDEVAKMEDVVVFHSGTKTDYRLPITDYRFFTSGGRVVGVTALGETLKEAVSRCYQAVDKIKFEGMHFRKDIAAKGIR